MKVLTLFSLIICTAWSLHTEEECCFPDKMQGFGNFVEQEKHEFVAFDFGRGRAVKVAADLSGDEFEVTDLKAGLQYDFDSNGCRVSSRFELKHGHDSCFGDNLKTGRNLHLAGQGSQLMELGFKETTGKDITYYIARDGPYCYPVLIAGLSSEGMFLTIFYDLKPNITEAAADMLYSSFDDCEQ